MEATPEHQQMGKKSLFEKFKENLRDAMGS